MSLIEKLKAGKNNVKIISWPGLNDKVGIVVLTEAEIQAAAFATEQLFKARGIEYSFSVADSYQSENNTQVLALALVHAEKRSKSNGPVRIFQNADELRELIAHPEVKAELVKAYNDWQTECSPVFASMTEQDYKALFDSVKKNASVLNDLSSRLLRGLIVFLANRPATSPTGNGSTSS